MFIEMIFPPINNIFLTYNEISSDISRGEEGLVYVCMCVTLRGLGTVQVTPSPNKRVPPSDMVTFMSNLLTMETVATSDTEHTFFYSTQIFLDQGISAISRKIKATVMLLGISIFCR